MAEGKGAIVPIARRGLMLVISSPSGAGKSTIARTLMERDRQIGMSVSVTTRQRRQSEIEGVHYHFASQREFERMRDSDSLLEWAEVQGNSYGTPREPVELAMSEGRDMLFDIDWQGAQQLYQEAGPDVVRVFVLPPTMEELERRLRESTRSGLRNGGQVLPQQHFGRLAQQIEEQADGSLVEDIGPVVGDVVEITAMARLGGGSVAIRNEAGTVWRYEARTRWTRIIDGISAIGFGS